MTKKTPSVKKQPSAKKKPKAKRRVDPEIFLDNPANGADDVHPTFPADGNYVIPEIWGKVYVRCELVHPNGRTYPMGPFGTDTGKMSWDCLYVNIPVTSSPMEEMAELTAYLVDNTGADIATSATHCFFIRV